MLRLVQNGIVSNNAYYKPSVSLAVDTNLAESIYLRLSSVASNSRGSTIVLSRDRNGTHPSGVPSANLNGDTVGTVTFAAFDQSDTVEISSFHSKSLVDSNQNMSGEVLFQVTNPKESSRFRFNDHEKMELGHDDEFYISRPNQTSGIGQFLSITGQQAEHGNGGSVNIYPERIQTTKREVVYQ